MRVSDTRSIRTQIGEWKRNLSSKAQRERLEFSQELGNTQALKERPGISRTHQTLGDYRKGNGMERLPTLRIWLLSQGRQPPAANAAGMGQGHSGPTVHTHSCSSLQLWVPVGQTQPMPEWRKPLMQAYIPESGHGGPKCPLRIFINLQRKWQAVHTANHDCRKVCVTLGIPMLKWNLNCDDTWSWLGHEGRAPMSEAGVMRQRSQSTSSLGGHGSSAVCSQKSSPWTWSCWHHKLQFSVPRTAKTKILMIVTTQPAVIYYSTRNWLRHIHKR